MPLHSHQHEIGFATTARIERMLAGNSMHKTKEKLTATKRAE